MSMLLFWHTPIVRPAVMSCTEVQRDASPSLPADRTSLFFEGERIQLRGTTHATSPDVVVVYCRSM